MLSYGSKITDSYKYRQFAPYHVVQTFNTSPNSEDNNLVGFFDALTSLLECHVSTLVSVFHSYFVDK